jgi:hypothetical protein
LFTEWPAWARGIVVIIIAVSLAVGLLLFLPDATGETGPEDEPITKYEKQILILEKQAADEALRTQIHQLFLIWLKDEAGQPQRAAVGARKARKAYIAIMDAIEKREREIRQ